MAQLGKAWIKKTRGTIQGRRGLNNGNTEQRLYKEKNTRNSQGNSPNRKQNVNHVKDFSFGQSSSSLFLYLSCTHTPVNTEATTELDCYCL